MAEIERHGRHETNRTKAQLRTTKILVAGEPVSRILSNHALRPIRTGHITQRGDHSSRSRIASGLKQPTRGSQLPALRRETFGPGRPSPPIWPCSTRGFPCPECCHSGGGLLPHLFTLTCALSTQTGGLPVFPQACRRSTNSPAVLFSVALSVAAARNTTCELLAVVHVRSPLALPGALPFVDGSCGVHDDGVRTFLPSAALASGKPAIARLTRYTTIIPLNALSQLEAVLRIAIVRARFQPCRREPEHTRGFNP